MKRATLQPQRLVISLALLTAAVLTPIRAGANPSLAQEQNQRGIATPKAELVPKDARMDGVVTRVAALEREVKAKRESDQLDTPLPLWLNGASGLIGLIGLLLALNALNRVKKQREDVLQLKERNQNLLTRIGVLEVQIEQERMASRNRSLTSSASAPPTTQTQTPTPQASAISWSIPEPAPEPASGPDPISKAALITALNAGDRQALRGAASAELNITSESENALAMGKSVVTELEEVSGGGSYWLITAEGQHWLYPTDRTLRGFAAAQPSKGLFHYEQQTIAEPKLIEPALLEKGGIHWQIKTMGKIAMP